MAEVLTKKQLLARISYWGLGAALGLCVALFGGNQLTHVIGAALCGFFCFPVVGNLKKLLVP